MEQRSVLVRFATALPAASVLSRLSALLEVGSFTGQVSQLVPLQLRSDGLLVASERAASDLAQRFRSSLGLLRLRSGLDLVAFESTPCAPSLSPCSSHGTSCAPNIAASASESLHVWDSDQAALAAPALTWEASCACKEGRVGANCSLTASSGCGADACSGRGLCHLAPGAARPSCHCPAQFAGERCEVDANECRAMEPRSGRAFCVHGLCSNREPGFACTCAGDWTGPRCDSPIDHCAARPCAPEAACYRGLGAFLCQCPFAAFGRTCAERASGFPEGSFATYPLADVTAYEVSLEFATVRRDALLLFQSVTLTAHVSVTLSARQLTLTFYRGLTQPDVVSVLAPAQAEGQWTRLVLRKREDYLEVAVDLCNGSATERAWAGADQDEAGCPRAVCSAPSCSQRIRLNAEAQRLLNRPTSGKFYVGGLTATAPAIRGLAVFDFVGCIRRVAGFASNSPAEQALVLKDRCPRPSATSLCANASSVCGGPSVGATCHDEWFEARCDCPEGYEPPTCSKGFQGYALSPGSLVVFNLRPDQLRQQLRVRRAVKEDSTFSLRMKTVHSDGVLMHARSDTERYTLLMVSQTGLGRGGMSE